MANLSWQVGDDARAQRRRHRRAYAEPGLETRHRLVQQHPETVDGDEATGQCYFQAQHLKTGTPGGETFIIAGKYDDRLTRTAQGWRIRHRTLETWWTDGNAAVVGA